MIYKSIIIQNEDEAKIIVRKSELKNKNFLAFSPDIRLILVQNSISNIFPSLDHFFDFDFSLNSFISCCTGFSPN